MSALVILMLVIIVSQQAFYMYTINKLVNKLMSRNYHDFQMGERVLKPEKSAKGRVVLDDAANEDLGHLAGIG